MGYEGMKKADVCWISGIAGQLYGQYVAGTDHELRVRREDLIQQGMIGYMKADRDYDAEKGGNGKNRAYYRVRVVGEIVDFLRKLPLIRVPHKQWGKVKQLSSGEHDLITKGKEVTVSRLSALLHWSEGEVDRIRGLRYKIEFYDRERGEDGGDCWELLANTMKSPERIVMEGEIADMIQLCLQRLQEKKRLILQLRYLDKQEYTLATLASRFLLSTERIRQIEVEALGRMKRCLKNKGVEILPGEVECGAG